ncbi:MAG TPA: filamentous hemagglutinin N-terminal domain-containing protein [Noviherbaspirillum sp.]|jgi:filamentous hemagglutinin family protein|uniref:two-partner secretion domain-containing protein n=1 Tax=Noviherbaspirillum sp. TaxID=1926288 RepID=UPI002F932B6E
MKTDSTMRHAGAAGTGRGRSLRRRLLPLLVAGCFGPAAWANPQGAQVVAGQASFSQQGAVLSVTNSPGAIINWQSFSIGAGETTRFIQQNAASAVLNRITGQDPTTILGTLQSNGRVFLVNPNGILFGQGARIDVNGLVASTLNISNEDFLAGKMRFGGGGQAGNIVNQGAITTPDGGQVYLVAPNIENTGIIHTPKGEVMLVAGHTVQLVDSTNPNLQVVLSAPDNQAVNIGQILTEGGRASIYGALIRQRGIVSADSAVVGENGKIVFKASRETLLEAGSVTSARGAGKGGEIQVLGERVGLMGNAGIDASGQAGGGTVLVGGDYKGGNAGVQNAKRSFVSADASIRADAVASGDGGKVIVWGDETTRAYGSISARGGAQGGNGGFVETSGAYLDVAGIRVDTRAPKGETGTWLLDPRDIFVRGSSATAPEDVDEFGDNGTADSEIAASTISSANSRVVLQAQRDIHFDSAVNMGAGGSLLAQAGNDINVNAEIRTAGGEVELHANYADYDSETTDYATGFGRVNVNADISTAGGDIRLRGVEANIAAAATLDSGAGNVDIEVTDKITNNGTILAQDRIALTADKMNLVGAIRTGADGEVVLVALGAAELGSTDSYDTATATLQLKDEELDTIQTGTLRIIAPDGINVSTAIHPAQVGRALSLVSDQGITQSVGATIAAPALAMSARFVDLQEANGVGVIAASVDEDFKFRTVNKLTVSEIDEISGITRYGYLGYFSESESSSSMSPGTILLQSDSAQGINQDFNGDIDTGGATLVLRSSGSVQLTNEGNIIDSLAASVSGGLDVYSDYDMQVTTSSNGITGVTAGGPVRLRTGYDALLSIDAQVNAGAHEVDLIADRLALNAMVYGSEASIRPYTPGRSITVGQEECVIEGCLSIVNLHRIAAATIGIGRDPLDYQYDPYEPYYGYGYSGPIHVAGITNTGSGALTDRNSATTLIGLLSSEDVTQGGAIDVDSLGAVAGGAVTLNHAGNRVGRVFGAALDGDFSFVNVGELSIGAPLGLDELYDTMGIWAANGNISVSNTGHLKVAGTASVLTGTGNIDLVAHSPLTVDGTVASGTGTISLEAASSSSPDDILTINGVVTTGGQVSLKAGEGIVINGIVHSANLVQAGGQGAEQAGIVHQAQNTVVATIAQATEAIIARTANRKDMLDPADEDEGKDKKGAGADKDEGAKKNEKAKKLYCN